MLTSLVLEVQVPVNGWQKKLQWLQPLLHQLQVHLPNICLLHSKIVSQVAGWLRVLRHWQLSVNHTQCVCLKWPRTPASSIGCIRSSKTLTMRKTDLKCWIEVNLVVVSIYSVKVVLLKAHIECSSKSVLSCFVFGRVRQKIKTYVPNRWRPH